MLCLPFFLLPFLTGFISVQILLVKICRGIMTKLQLRLKFNIESTLKVEEVLGRIEKYLNQDDVNCEGWVSEKNAMLVLPENLRRYWSPFLNLEVEKNGAGAIIKGRFGPNPTVWTMFIFFYMLFSFIGLGSLMFGLTQITLGHNPWTLWIFPFSLILLLVEYIVAGIGQRIGNEQTSILLEYLHFALDEPSEGKKF